MFDWYKFIPADTLFFKGASNAIRGENHSSTSVFPPPYYTIEGALRTEVLKQNNIGFADYNNLNFNNQNMIKSIGRSGDISPFNVIGPLLSKDKELFIPAPFSWYYSKMLNKEFNKNKMITFKTFYLEEKKTDIIFSNKETLLWVKSDNGDELMNCGGNWIKYSDLSSNKEEKDLFKLEYFVDTEPRTGIGIEVSKGTVHEGHLYQFNHSRLKNGISLVFGLTKQIPIKVNGVLTLGAEQRFGKYEKIEKPMLIEKIPDAKKFLSLSIIEGTDEANESLIATGKTKYIGGWDLHKGFHKQMKGFFPAGTVFNKNINKNLIGIKEN